MLVVAMTNHLAAGEHVRDVIGRCAQSLDALKLLAHHGMSDDPLRHVYTRPSSSPSCRMHGTSSAIGHVSTVGKKTC